MVVIFGIDGRGDLLIDEMLFCHRCGVELAADEDLVRLLEAHGLAVDRAVKIVGGLLLGAENPHRIALFFQISFQSLLPPFLLRKRIRFPYVQ